ncbi:hypothetical protein ACQPXH_26695 [Nocardia sp. CA-135953]
MLIRGRAPRESSDGPEFDIEFDYGEQRFPEGQLFSPEVYRADV